jgi:hypothetical protein
MKTFAYQPSVPIIQWGYSFDSLLELKYALSINDEYEFLRNRVSIFFDPKTREPTNYLRGNTRRYTPDFLIRHKQTKKAHLVELKPRVFQHNEQLILRKEVAEKYIRWKKLDWAYTVIFDDEINLNEHQQKEFTICCKSIWQSKKRLYFEQCNKQFDRSQGSFFKGAPNNKLINFVMFGT